MKFKFGIAFPNSLLIIVAWSTLVWLLVTFFTRPTEEATLLSFYKKVHPGGRLWKTVSDKLLDIKGDKGYLRLFIDWIAGSVCVMFSLLGVGKLIFGPVQLGLLFLLLAAVAGGVIYCHLSKIGWEKLGD